MWLSKFGAGDGIRTRNPQLGKLIRYRYVDPVNPVKHVFELGVFTGFTGLDMIYISGANAERVF